MAEKKKGLLEKLAADPLTGAFALQLGGNAIQTIASRREAKRSRKAQLDALKPVEARLRQLNFGATASEGALFQGLQRRGLSDLARRGVLPGSTAPAELAATLAPAELQSQQRRDQLEFGLASAKARIEGDTELPGFGQAFGGTLSDVGGFIALREGIKQGREATDGNSVTRSLSLMKAAGVDVDEEQFNKILQFGSLAL